VCLCARAPPNCRLSNHPIPVHLAAYEITENDLVVSREKDDDGAAITCSSPPICQSHGLFCCRDTSGMEEIIWSSKVFRCLVLIVTGAEKWIKLGSDMGFDIYLSIPLLCQI
jgi:hypothetical protein